MPLQQLQFRPGVNREGTTLANEGGWFECDKVRFRSGYPEKIGGWSAISYAKFIGTARSLWNWITLTGYNLLGVGTNQKFYVEDIGGNFYDITPLRITTGAGGSPVTTAPSFAATNGSFVITVTDAAAIGFQTGDIVTFSGATDVNAQITAAVLNQQYVITYVSATTYTINARTAGTSLESPGGFVFSLSNASGGGAGVTAKYQISPGYPIYTIGTGWGAGPWSPYTPYALSANPFATTSGSGIITVTHPSHGFSAGQYVNFSGATAVGGITADQLNSTFQIFTVSTNTYTIKTNGGTGSVLATSTTTGGGSSVIEDHQTGTRGWGSGYSTGIGLQLRLWSQTNFGDILLFNPRGSGFYKWDPTSNPVPDYDTPGQLVTGFDVPAYINQIMLAEASRITIAFGCSGYGVYGTAQDPLLIRWSDPEDYTSWSVGITNQAGDYRLSRGSYIVGALQTRQEILVWTDAALYSMQYLGPPYIFGFNLLADNISIISPNAMATANGVTYWMGTDKFYIYSGRVETLPCALRQYVFNDINTDQSAQVFAGTNEGYSEIWWFYCSENSNTVDRYVIFNYLDRVWYYGSLSRTAWIDSALRPYPQAALGVQATELSSSINATATSILVNDASGFPNSGTVQIDNELISYAYKSDTQLFSCVRGVNGTTAASHVAKANVSLYASNILVFHEAAVDDGTTNPPSPIYSYIQSSDFDIGDGHNYGFVWQIVPDITFDGSSANYPTVDFIVRPRQNPGANYGSADAPSITSNQVYGTQVNPITSQTYTVNSYNVQQFTEIVNTRIRGRQMAFKIESNTLGTQWQLGTPRINIRPDGRR